MSTAGTRSQPQIEESYCFKWSDYQNHLSGVVRQLLEEECMVDVTLVAAGERIQAHRIVLCACSSLFRQLLGQVDEDHSTIILSDVSPKDVRSIVEFSYHGQVRIPVENISDLLEAAHSLKICGLMEIDGLDENDAIISAKDFNDETVESPNELMESEDKGPDVPEESEIYKDNWKNCDTTDIPDSSGTNNKKRKRRRDAALKREYSAEMLVSAINDLKSGRTLIEAATKHNIPRSTLYMRAKALGIQLSASRNEYPAECMKAAIDAVVRGSSLQHASDKFYIPKTVLWRRIQKEGYQILKTEFKRSYGSEKREAAVKALQRGENLTKVSLEFQIPKTTLFRDKAKLVDQGKLPESFWKKRKTGDERVKRLRLEEAVAACKGGKMSQAAASMAYRIPKTTIWRRLQQDCKNLERVENSREPERSSEQDEEEDEEEEGVATAPDEDDDDGEKHLQTSEYELCEVSPEIPAITYIDDNSLPEDSVIILTTDDVHSLDLDQGRRIIVDRDTGEGYGACELTGADEDFDDAGYRASPS